MLRIILIRIRFRSRSVSSRTLGFQQAQYNRGRKKNEVRVDDKKVSRAAEHFPVAAGN